MMIDYILNFELNGKIGILLYWVPLSFCVFSYTLRTAQNYMKDKANREKIGEWYEPTDRVGTLIGRAIVSFIPIANLWAAMFDVAPKVLSRLFDYLDIVFNAPIVPDSDSARAIRRQD